MCMYMYVSNHGAQAQPCTYYMNSPAYKYRVASVTSRGIPVPSSRQLQERSQWTPHATQEVTDGGSGDRELVPHLHLKEIGRQHSKHKLLEGEHILTSTCTRIRGEGSTCTRT